MKKLNIRKVYSNHLQTYWMSAQIKIEINPELISFTNSINFHKFSAFLLKPMILNKSKKKKKSTSTSSSSVSGKYFRFFFVKWLNEIFDGDKECKNFISRGLITFPPFKLFKYHFIALFNSNSSNFTSFFFKQHKKRKETFWKRHSHLGFIKFCNSFWNSSKLFALFALEFFN
jgi:hypothetical protein